MKRKAVYHKQSNRHRVVSVANDQWQLQEHVGRDDHLRQVDDGWRNVGRALPFDAAVVAMYQNMPAT